MTRVGFSPAKTTKHSELTDVSTPHALADLVAAVCSETEADGKISLHSAPFLANFTAAMAAAILNEASFTAAMAATAFEDASLTAALAASIFDEAGLAAQKAADIFDHANLSTAKAVSIALHTNLTTARYDAIIALMADLTKLYGDATLARFQAVPATGDFSSVQNLNNNDIGTQCYGQALARYGEVDFEKWVKINQWRQYGYASNDENGVWKIEYYDGTWHDWVTGIPTKKIGWTGMATETEVICKKIRLTVTTLDSGSGGSAIGELEVYHS